MQPAKFDFPAIRRGNTTRLGFIADTRDVFTGEVANLPLAYNVVAWSITVGSEVRTRTSTDGLVVERVQPGTDVLFWEMSAAETAALPAGVALPFLIKATNSDGVVLTLAEGRIPVEG